MSYIDSTSAPSPYLSRARGAITRSVFIATICTSAFLLFMIQPMFSKMAVPLVGGSPGVWTTAMLFFQSVLLGGYAYAHWLASSFPVSRQRQIHLCVTAVAVFALPLALPTGWSLPTDGTVTVWLLALFAVSIGAPFFALSANSPLLQEWYASTGNEDGADPYFLYAASNIGSFGALLAYPLLIEPSIGLSDQGSLWSLGYVLLIVGLAASAFMARDVPVTAVQAEETAAVAAPSWREIGFWILLAFVPSSMMLSVTAKIATDIGSFPLIWVTTLGLYLLTYVFAFSARFRAISGPLPRLQMIASIGMFILLCLDPSDSKTAMEMFVLLGFLFLTALTFHTRLADCRPDKRYLTMFFLCMSAGGALGGIFNSIIAPIIFNDVHEFSIAVALAFAAAPVIAVNRTRDVQILLGAASLFAILYLVSRSDLAGTIVNQANAITAATVVIASISAIILLQSYGHPVRQVALAAIAIVVTNIGVNPTLVMQERSFFGVYKVQNSEDGTARLLKHGTTVHGMMRTDTAGTEPALYYARPGPFGQFFGMMQPGDSVGIVGLGAGGLACHRVDEISKVFYEIDPLVDRIARDPRYFGMLEKCKVTAPTILGDARIEMEKMPDNVHDHIVLDAFSSDSVPVHLLTREAFATYDRVMPESGGLFIHISNRYFDLVGPVTRVAETLGFEVYYQHYLPDEIAQKEDLATFVRALVATKSPALIATLTEDSKWKRAQAWADPAWTDDYANTLSAWQ